MTHTVRTACINLYPMGSHMKNQTIPGMDDNLESNIAILFPRILHSHSYPYNLLYNVTHDVPQKSFSIFTVCHRYSYYRAEGSDTIEAPKCISKLNIIKYCWKEMSESWIRLAAAISSPLQHQYWNRTKHLFKVVS